jgi:hypothetical protein
MVNVKANAQGGVVTPYQGNPAFGFVILESVETVMQNGWLQEKSRSTIMRGATEMLSKHFTIGQQLAGKIAVTECLEDDIPAQCASQLQKDLPFEEQIAPYLKRAGSDDAPILTAGGKRILRFTSYDASGATMDTRVQHDNVDAIKAFNEAQSSADAKLPK